MKKFVLSTLVALSLATASVAALAENASTAAPSAAVPGTTLKVGVINLQELLQKLPQMKQITSDMKKQFGDRQTQIVSLQNTFKKDADDYRRNSAVLSGKDKQDAEQKLMKEEQDLQQMQVSFQKDYMAEQNKQVNSLMEQIKTVVDKVAADEKFDLILVNTSVAYSSKSLDITAPILNQLMKK